MSFYDWGNIPVKSTQGLATNPTTSVLVAELVSSEFGTNLANRDINYRVTWIVGASTAASFRLERCLSSGVGSTAIREQLIVFTALNQSAQYVSNYRLTYGDRLRVRVDPALASANAAAKIEAEPIT